MPVIKRVKFKRSWSLKMASARTTKFPSTKATTTPYKKPQPTPTKKRPSKLWSDTFKPSGNEGLTAIELKRQEAIYELYQGEEDLIEDLKLAKTAYRDSMKQLKLLNETELQQIFGTLDHLLPLHEELIQMFQAERNPDGTTESAGKILIDWLPGLRRYVTYCGNLVYAKALLDEKKQDPRVEDFLQRCLESPFSRKLDLWNFLDVPRSRLVKYPLLFKNIQKLTPPDHPDLELLNTAIKLVEDIILEVDEKTGESKCQFIITRLEYLDDKQKDPLVEQSKILLCAGILRNNRGTKLHVFLFKDVLVLTRPATRAERMCYQVYRQPIPSSCLVLEDLQDGDTSKMGSFRNAFGHSQGAKNMFRVSSKDPSGGQAHTLQANDEHDKKQWVQCLKRAISESEDQNSCTNQNPSSCTIVDRSPPAKRR